MLTGENGILGRTQEATVQSQIAEAKEKVTIAAIEAFEDYYLRAYVGNTEAFSEQTLNVAVLNAAENIDKPTQITISTDPTETPPTITISYAKENGGVAQEFITGTVVSGKITWGELINREQIIAEQRSYGKKVSWTNMPDTEANKWRLFYTEGETAYLIRESVATTRLNELSTWKDPSTTEITDEDLALAKTLNPEYTAWDKKTNNVLNTNIVATAALCNQSCDLWAKYADKTSEYYIPGATMVIGAPPIEMFVKSYNITHSLANYEALGVENITMAVKVLNKTTDTGYTPGINKEGGEVADNAYSIWCGRYGNTTIDKAIYFPPVGLFWIASPSASNYKDVMYGNNESGGCLYSYSCISYNMGIRPIVAVPRSSIGKAIILSK